MKSLPAVISALLLAASLTRAEPAPLGRMQTVKDQFLPGPELKPKAGDGRAPVVLRITAVYPHGTAGFRYDLTWSALEAGSYDLTQYLEPAAGAAAVALPPVPVEAAGILPPGPPQELPRSEGVVLPSIGGYRFWLPAGIALWVLGGAAFFYYTRRRRAAAGAAATAPGITLAQRLEPLLQRSLNSSLTVTEKAELERLVIVYGQERVGTAGQTTAAVWKNLREDADTGPWLRTLEDWLHRPSPVAPAPAEIETLLARIRATPPAATA